MTIFGPGSEWFWAMAQFALVAATIVGLARQIRQQNAAGALQRLVSLQGDWESARLVDARLRVAIWRKHAGTVVPNAEASAPIAVLCNFFENLADLFEAGYITWTEIENTWGQSLVTWWALLDGTIKDLRGGTITVYVGFERLAARSLERAKRRGDHWEVSDEDIPGVLDVQIARNRARLRILRDIQEGVIPEEPPSAMP